MSQTITLPGMIDCHVHFREPGLTHKADMASESKAARAGGVFTVCEMPNTIPPTTTIEAFAEKVKIANAITDCDIRFFFGITEAAHLEELKKLWTDDAHQDIKGRCSGVKLFLDNSTGDQKVDGGIIDSIFATCAELKVPLVAHCEDPEMNAEALEANTSSDITAHSWVRPSDSEENAIMDAIKLAQKHGAAFHVAHLSTWEGLKRVREAKDHGLPITCEVTPHHLFLSTDDYETLGTLGKMNPPLRQFHHTESLWRGVVDGTVDCIATDHAPHLLEEKQVEPSLSAPSGVPGVETMIPLLLTVAAGKWPHPNHDHPGFDFTYEDIERLCFDNPNKIYNLGKTKDKTITVDPFAEWKIKGSDLHSKCGWTPYEGWKVVGKIL